MNDTTPATSSAPMNDRPASAHLEGVASTSTRARTGKKTSNGTHRKRLARQFADRSGRPYAAALEIVTRAADAGRLPEPLDAAGMEQALEILMAVEPEAAQSRAGQPIQAECHAARTGEGYWTCDVPGGCADCRHLANEIDDVEQIAAWDAERKGISATVAEPENLYLVRSSLAALRLVWQGRVAKEPHGSVARFTINSHFATTGQSLDLVMLERDGYITARLMKGEEWAIARTTDFGDRVLAANRADTDKFRDGLPQGAGLGEDGEDGEDAVGQIEPDRLPYVGDGADGARRSAQIDREEADGLDRDDPRMPEVLASAARWDAQAERAEQQTQGSRRYFVDIPVKWAERGAEHPMWRRPVPEHAGRLVAIDTDGDQYVAQGLASRILGDDGWGGISSTVETGPDPEEVFARILDHKHAVVGLPGHIEDCLGCTNEFFAIWGYQVGQGVVCKACVADVHHECVGRRNNNRMKVPGGWETACNCECRVERGQVPAAGTQGTQGTQGTERADRLLFEATSTTLDAYLDRCAPGDPSNLLAVATTLAAATRVETWWYPTAWGNTVDEPVRHLVRQPKRALSSHGDLVLVDADGETSEESMDWTDEPDKAGRHRVHLDGHGVTFFTPTGEASRTHRALDADEPLTSMAAVQQGPDDARDPAPEGFQASGSRAVLASLDRRAESRADQVGHVTATTWRVAHEGNPVERCTVSSWRDKASKRDPHGYGPGGYNRCVKAAGHAPDGQGAGGSDPHHVDEWGHVFLLTGKAFKVLNNISSDEMADIAREAGMHVSDGSDMSREPSFPPKPNTLWVSSGKGARVEIMKVSTVYSDEERLTAQVVHPVPPRTTVLSFPFAEARGWREPTDAEVRRYERAWGFSG